MRDIRGIPRRHGKLDILGFLSFEFCTYEKPPKMQEMGRYLMMCRIIVFNGSLQYICLRG